MAALLERGYNASRVDLPHSTYDIVVELEQNITRLQVKTVTSSGSISFKGGTRGGVDRKYHSDVKEYTQSTRTSDCVVGVSSTKSNGDTDVDFYFIPTLYIEKLNQGSLSINKLRTAKNNWELLEKCKNKDFVLQIFEQ